MDISFKHVNYDYQAGTPFEQRALFDVNVMIPNHSYTAIIGHTGSGKSTILQHLNALLKPTEGEVWIGHDKIDAKTINKFLKPIRKKVGIVFQFPESQLFEETVIKDIAFGPQNFGVEEAEALEIARQTALMVGLEESVLNKSPFELSGGQMRRVAIAGVLAMQPEVLVLDEPTAGLDPQGRIEMMEMFNRLYREKGMSIVLVTHNMDDVCDYANHVIVVEKGEIVKTGTPKEIFSDIDWMIEKQLGRSTANEFFSKLVEKGLKTEENPLTITELTNILISQYQEVKGC